MQNALNFLRTHEKNIVEDFKALIKARTENPPGDVSEGIDVIRRILDDYNIDYKIIEPTHGRKNIIAEIGDGPTLILNGHVDVVPAGNGWTHDPFSAEIENGKIYGRGSTDMKSGLIAILYSFLAHRNEPPGRIILMIVPDEETGATYGTKYLLENKIISGDACLIAEPTGELENRKYSIVAGERGVLWVKIKSHGKAKHGSLPMLGENAIKKMMKLIPNLPEIIPQRIDAPKDAIDLILNGKEILYRKHPKAGDALDHFTINIGTIKGGQKVNMVPDYCEIEIDIRVPIGASSNDAETILRKITKEDYELEIINRIEPSYTPPDHPLVKSIISSAEKVLGYPPKPIGMAATSDARIFRFAGIPTINFGPGYLEIAHARDEFVYLEDVLYFTKVYAIFIYEFLHKLKENEK